MSIKGKILATPRSFGKQDKSPVELLEKAGYNVALNPVGKILTKEQMIEHLADAVGVIVGVDPLDADIIAMAPKLRAIAKYGVGTDNIDIQAAESRGISVSRTVGANINAVADYAFALMMAVARNILWIDARCRKRDWSKQMTIDVHGKTLGILGLGAIGKAVARRASGFDMHVMAYDPCFDMQFAQFNKIECATAQDIYRNADFISLHMPLTEQTRMMIGAREFALMKPTAVFINTSRGGIVDEDALKHALKNGRIYGAGVDAFSEEPPGDDELYNLPNLIMGSHCAASTVGAVRSMGILAAKNLLRDLENQPLI
jgi:phosphoglycerate dehydrogenase-like enzyme